MQKLENLANMLDRAECPEEAEFVRDLWKQRAELLEALKRSKYMNTTPEDWRFIQDAITKAEATK